MQPETAIARSGSLPCSPDAPCNAPPMPPAMENPHIVYKVVFQKNRVPFSSARSQRIPKRRYAWGARRPYSPSAARSLDVQWEGSGVREESLAPAHRFSASSRDHNRIEVPEICSKSLYQDEGNQLLTGVNSLLEGSKRSNAMAACDATHHGALVRFLGAYLADKQDAQDLAQEAYLRLVRASQSRLIDDPVAYLFRIAQNLLNEWYKSMPPPHDPLKEEMLVSDARHVEDSAARAQQMDQLAVVLTHLSPKCRAAILMHRRDGMTYNEIATALGISSAMVKKYLSQGLARCRRELRTYYES